MAVPEDLRERLGSPDEETRHQAVLDLREAGGDGLPLLAAAIGDSSWRVRKAALEILVASPGAETPALLAAGLRDEANAGRRNSSMEALIRLGPAALPALAPLLADPDPDLRKFVVDALGSIEGPGVERLLVTALADADENVSGAAAEHLGRRRVGSAVPALTGRLRGGGPWLTFSCLRALGEIGDPAAAPVVTSLLAEPGLRKAALEALGGIGGADAVPHLLDALFSGDRPLRRVAAVSARRLLERLGRGPAGEALRAGVRARADAAFLGFLRDLLRQEDAQLRAASVALLGLVPAPALEIVLEALPEAAEAEQEALARVLEGLPEADLALLPPRLLDPSPAVRRRVAEALGRRGSADAVPGLLRLLSDGTGHVRAAAAASLGAIGDPAAAAALAGLLRDSFPDVREAGLEALVALGSRSESRRSLVLSLLGPQLQAGEEELAATVVRVMGRLGGRGEAARLGLALRDDRPVVRRAAVEALGALGPEAVEALRPALTDEDVAVRREAVLRLGATGAAGAVPLLLPMLQDEDLWVRVRAVQALARFDHPEAGAAILEAAETEPPGPKRLAAVRALGQARVPGSLRSLTALAAAGDRETRAAACEALGLLADPAALPVLLPLLADPAWGLRAAAARALAPFAADPQVREALGEAARADADPLVRSTAAALLARGAASG